MKSSLALLCLSLACIYASDVNTAVDWDKLTGGYLDEAQRYWKYLMGEHKNDLIDGKPWFCHGKKCPPFKVMGKTSAYEEKCFEKTSWLEVKTPVGPYSLKAYHEAFDKLFNYIQGNNDKGKKMHMTFPVLVTIEFGRQFDPDTMVMKVLFFVAEEDVPLLPKATDADIKLVTMDAMCVYSMFFSGWQTLYNADQQFYGMARNLEQSITSDGKDYDNSVFYFAGYDPPYTVFNRYNELWVAKKGSKREL